MRQELPAGFKCSDELVLAGRMLQALDGGRIAMHAVDYQDIAGWISAELALMETDVLRAMHRQVPECVQTIVENHLHRRSDSAWAVDAWAQPVADCVWASLLERLAA
jgi:hypothetical protein